MFCAWGKNGQYINVVPSQKLVLIRMGNAPGGSGAASMAVGFNDEIWKYVNRLPCSSATHTLPTNHFTLYPNPVAAGSTIVLKTVNSNSAISSAVLCDAMRRILFSYTFNNEGNINNPTHIALPQTLPSGAYTLRIETQNQAETLPLMVR
jgi:hypothetical protein